MAFIFTGLAYSAAFTLIAILLSKIRILWLCGTDFTVDSHFFRLSDSRREGYNVSYSRDIDMLCSF